MSTSLGFYIRVQGLAQSESGKPLDAFLVLDRYGRGKDGFVTDKALATKFDRLPYAERWLNENADYWARRAEIIHAGTGQVVRS